MLHARIADAGDPGRVLTFANGSGTDHTALYLIRAPIPFSGYTSTSGVHITSGSASLRTASVTGMTDDVVTLGAVCGDREIPGYRSGTTPTLGDQLALEPMRVGILLYPKGTAAVDQSVNKSDSGAANSIIAAAFNLT